MAERRRTRHSKSKSIEKQEIAILEAILNATNILSNLTKGDDDFPNIDGYIHLLNKERETTGQMLQAQIKPVRYKKDGTPTSVCKIEFLTYAYESTSPVLLISVDVEKEIAYWAYLSPESMKNIIEGAGVQKTLTLSLPKKHLLKKGSVDFTEEWKRICFHHRNESNDKIISRLVRSHKKWPLEKQASFASLETLSELVFYRTNEGDYPLFDYVLSLAEEACSQGEDAKLKYLEILEHIYYYRPKEVLSILFRLISSESSPVADKARKILLEVSKYNFHILNTLGYGPHRVLVDFLREPVATNNTNAKNLSVEMLRNILATSFEGTSHPSEMTITFHSGPLEPTPYLQSIRADAFSFLFGLLHATKDVKEKVKILSTIGHSFYAPDSGFTEDAVRDKFFSMSNKEISGAIKNYKKLAFTRQNTLSEELPLVYEIERQLALLTVWKRNIRGLDSFLSSIRESKSAYSLYRILVGDGHDLNIDQGFDTANTLREQGIQRTLDAIEQKNATKWLILLAKVAVFKDTQEYWKFNQFRDFLARIGKNNPKLADYLLNIIFTKKNALCPFADSFLFGLRLSSIPLWDKYVKRIEKDKNIELTRGILTSFEFHSRTEIKDKIRLKDIELLEKIVEHSGAFSFLTGKIDNQFVFQAFRTSLYLYRVAPERCRALILNILKAHPDKLALLLDTMSFAFWAQADWLTLDDWTMSELNVLENALVEVQKIDHNEEQILLKLGERNFNSLISVFERRIARASTEKTDYSIDPPRFSRYDAVPHRFSLLEIPKFIGEHKKYKAVLTRWIRSLTKEYSSESYELSNLIELVGGPYRGSAVQELIATGDTDSIKKVISLFPFMETPDYQLCFQVIDATDDKEIHSQVGGKMRNIGLVSGSPDDDIFGIALSGVKQRLEREGLTHTSQRVRDFSVKMIRDLEKEILASGDSHKKRLAQRKQEFEESNN